MTIKMTNKRYPNGGPANVKPCDVAAWEAQGWGRAVPVEEKSPPQQKVNQNDHWFTYWQNDLCRSGLASHQQQGRL